MKEISGSDVNWTDEYAAIGEYVICFEDIVGMIRSQTAFIFSARGLNELNDSDSRLAAIVFGYRLMTARPLLDCYISMTNEVLRSRPEAVSVLEELDSFKSRCLKQYERRNEVLHSNYWIGPGVDFTLMDEQEIPLIAMKDNPNHKGYNSKKAVSSKEELKEDIAELRKLRADFAVLLSKIHPLLKKD